MNGTYFAILKYKRKIVDGHKDVHSMLSLRKGTCHAVNARAHGATYSNRLQYIPSIQIISSHINEGKSHSTLWNGGTRVTPSSMRMSPALRVHYAYVKT